MNTAKRYRNPASGKPSRVFPGALPSASLPVLHDARATSRYASSIDAMASSFGSRLGSRASSGTGSCSLSEFLAVEKIADEKSTGHEQDGPDTEEDAEGSKGKITSPLHSSAKEAWLAKRTDEQMSSLFIPPSCKPKILEFAAPHANNLANIFQGYHQHSNQPALGCYARYGYIPSNAFPLNCSPLSYLPLVLLVPPAGKNTPPLTTPPGKQQTLVSSSWQECIQGGRSQAAPPAHVAPNPPPQSIFTHVGVAPRRHFTVHPDWRPRIHW